MRSFVPRTVRAAIWDLRKKFGHLEHHDILDVTEERADVRRIMRECEPGGQLNAVERSMVGYKGPLHSFMVRKALWDAPAFTVIKLDEIVHPDGERWLSWREGLRLSGYPDDFTIAQPQEATQAVLPPVSEHIGRILSKAIQSGRTVNVGLNVVDWRQLAGPYRPGAVRERLREAGEI